MFDTGQTMASGGGAPNPVSAPIFEQHPQRGVIQAEAHARPPLPIAGETAEVWHWVLTDVDPAQLERAGIDPVNRHELVQLDEGLLRLERHTEFLSATFLGTGAPTGEALKILSACKGLQLTGVRIVFRASADPALAERLFHANRQFGGLVCDGSVMVRTDFQVGPDSMVDYLVEGPFASAYERGLMAKWLIDLETYRIASLLALPLVRASSPRLEKLEVRAAAQTQALSELDDDAMSAAVDTLSGLLAEASGLQAETRFRIAASSAYYQLVRDRLRLLQERAAPGRQTLTDFVEHRLAPGMKTVFAFERRAADLSQTVAAAMDLARTRIERRLQLQNQELLASMERRAHQQVHLAQAVEGLSVAAITYYIVSLIAKELESLHIEGLPDKLIVAVSIPVVAGLVWFAAHRARKAVEKL